MLEVWPSLWSSEQALEENGDPGTQACGTTVVSVAERLRQRKKGNLDHPRKREAAASSSSAPTSTVTQATTKAKAKAKAKAKGQSSKTAPPHRKTSHRG